MLAWLKRHTSIARPQGAQHAEAPKSPRRAMSGQYRLLYEYLENRYANTVVLTFAEIEDLLGFALPDQARLRLEWWTNGETSPAESRYSDSWILASRTAMPNLLARTVAFERAS